jgi:hypothetical protein
MGYAFSSRLAVLAAAELVGGVSSERFSQIMVGVVLRYSPRPWLWVQVGPGAGEVSYSFTNPMDTPNGLPGVSATTEDGAVEGGALLAAAGASILRKPKWSLDVQARFGKCWYEGFQGTDLSFGVAVTNRGSSNRRDR